jgi:hypothetical protein
LGLPFRFLVRKLIAQTGSWKIAPAVPSKEMSSIRVAAGLFFSLVMIFRWWVWTVAMSSSSENVMTVSRSGR